MKTNAALRTNKMQMVNTDQFNIDQQPSLSIMTAKDRTALKVIYSHAGKRRVFETYQATNPQMAKKYLECIGRNPWAMYIRWDKDKGEFVA